jgi:hypothetical protein
MLNARDPEHTNNTVPWSDLLGIRSGNGATFRGSFGIPGTPAGPTTNWFHFSIPTPAVFPQLGVEEHLGITVDQVSVYYQTPAEGDITIRQILVTDGEIARNVHALEGGAGIFGDHRFRHRELFNSWPIDPITMELETAHGVLISVLVRFEVNGEITFTGAAIHYRVGA